MGDNIHMHTLFRPHFSSEIKGYLFSNTSCMVQYFKKVINY